MVRSMIKPVTGVNGPFYVITEKDGDVINITLSLNNLSLALDKVKSDHVTALSGAIIKSVHVVTTAT